MNKWIRMILIMGVTLVVLVVVFYLLLPMTSIPDRIGGAYFIVALAASLGISLLVSWGLGKLIK
jgi:hypothetical protein